MTRPLRERIAIVGGGVSGLGAAWMLDGVHEVHVFEAADYLGGHTHTVPISTSDGRELQVDTGFIVYNETTYPLLSKLFEKLQVETQPTNMSFSMQCRRCGLLYSGLGATGLFADPRNATKPSFLGFLRGIQSFHRFGRRTPPVDPIVTLGDHFEGEKHANGVARHYAFPLASALWSTGIPDIRRFPLATFIAFFRAHHLFQIRDRLDWRTVTGGSHRYVEAMRSRMGARIHLSTPVASIRRETDGVRLRLGDGEEARFDRVVVATHADEALAMLADPTREERRLLGAWSYAESDTWLHSDATLLPRPQRAHASWNYHLDDCAAPAPGPTMTYNLNRLQRLDTEDPVLVTLNPSRPPDRVHHRRTYRHPIFTPRSVATQGPLGALGEETRTHFCGAHLGFGFHEDGLRSGMELGERLGGRFA